MLTSNFLFSLMRSISNKCRTKCNWLLSVNFGLFYFSLTKLWYIIIVDGQTTATASTTELIDNK